MGNNLSCCCKGDFVVSKAEIRDDTTKSRSGRLQNAMKINTDIQETSRGLEKQKFGMLNTIKETPIYYDNMDNENTFDNDTLEERKKQLRTLKSIPTTKKLTLEISSKLTTESVKLNVCCTGIDNSLRNEDDGVVYFGCLNNEKENLNDFLIKLPDDNEIDDRTPGRHFQIKYNIIENKYFIRDLGNGLGTFMKINNSFILRSDSLINIGDSFIVVTIGECDLGNYNNINSNDNNDNRNTCVSVSNMLLTLKIYSGTFKFDPICYVPEENKIIKIGRSNEVDVSIEDNLLSRSHCFIKYDLDNNYWILCDGSVLIENNSSNNKLNETSNIKSSTNGTWIYLKDDIELTNDFMFKTNQTVFKAYIN